jgi:outer membrane protein OmpA-like peptidoglycan-associated protein
MRLDGNHKLTRGTTAGAWLTKILSALLLFIVSSVQAQHIIPLPGAKNDKLTVCIDSVYFTSLPGANDYGLQFRFVVMGDKLPRKEHIVIRPQLTSGDSVVSFPPVEIDGQWAYYHQVRSGVPPTGLRYRAKNVRDYRHYSGRLAVADWMQLATLSFQVERTNGCGDILSSDAFILRAPTPEYKVYREEDIKHEEVSTLQGSAYVSFPVNRSEVRPDFHNNEVELERLRHTIDSVSNDTTIEVVRIEIKGFASPEGKYANNDRLARERTSSLTRYIIEHTNVSPMLFHTAYEPEDWVGLRNFVDSTSLLTNRDAMLRIIDSDGEPDEKLSRIVKNHPEDYKTLDAIAFPLLRHTDYQISYTQKSVTRTAGAVHTDTVYCLRTDTLVQPAPEIVEGERYKTFRPLLAVKTNLLFEALLAPNVEIEVPFGTKRRWSAMAEVWCPWWRFDHNAAGDVNKYYRSDQRPTRIAYQLLTVGAELRYWFPGRCPEAVPVLTGPFVGLYVAGGKYDLGRDGKGDQGEFFSVGISAGYSWPIARHWNLELSAAVGYVGGPKVHYENEFDDARLIYRSDDDWKSWFLPTKLKLSLVYVIGKKGGAK